MTAPSTPTEEQPLVVHCHLRWDGVWQRPQQILSRMARTRPIHFIEEPYFLPPQLGHMQIPAESGLETFPEQEGYLRIREENGVTVIQPVVPHQQEVLPWISETNQPIVRKLVHLYLQENGLASSENGAAPTLAWFYSPMFLYIYEGNDGAFEGTVTLYDCMDTLHAFEDQNDPNARTVQQILKNRENQMMEQAHMVFTGGLTMYEQRKDRHTRCFRFDSGVDVDHFGQATLPETEIPADARDLPRPILGYYGVIDERMDYDAIRALSKAFPEATILLIGPVVKVDPATLPQAPNIVYLGQRSYPELPGYLKAFDVALVPFADNEATKSLSPTKTLEYFAGKKPVVSSPIRDVVENYGDIVRLARSPEEYVSAVRATLEEDNSDRIRRGLEAAQAKTWDVIVGEMEQLIQEAVRS